VCLNAQQQLSDSGCRMILAESWYLLVVDEHGAVLMAQCHVSHRYPAAASLVIFYALTITHVSTLFRLVVVCTGLGWAPAMLAAVLSAYRVGVWLLFASYVAGRDELVTFGGQTSNLVLYVADEQEEPA
jgi:hypothetical protein